MQSCYKILRQIFHARVGDRRELRTLPTLPHQITHLHRDNILPLIPNPLHPVPNGHSPPLLPETTAALLPHKIQRTPRQILPPQYQITPERAGGEVGIIDFERSSVVGYAYRAVAPGEAIAVEVEVTGPGPDEFAELGVAPACDKRLGVELQGQGVVGAELERSWSERRVKSSSAKM